ncbi:MAG TPA: DNA (cytosine-5-)-methyltransferase, partial [Chthoniobacterales bacterium]
MELCAGGGGQALGLEWAKFHHLACVEYEPQFCTTLRKNRPHWNVMQDDIRNVEGSRFAGVDLIAGGVPCPPFSVAGKQLGAQDERNMFPAALQIIADAKPRAVLLENVPGLASARFSDYRRELFKALNGMGYQVFSRLLQSSNFGVPQLRPRFLIVALRAREAEFFNWPHEPSPARTVGDALADLMAENGWLGAEAWASRANDVAPTLVGGSRKHGGPDLGPTRAKQQWAKLGVDGVGIADSAPLPAFPVDGKPRLTLRMAARVQSFPDEWIFTGGKTAAYRQIGNAFPPRVAHAIGASIFAALKLEKLQSAKACLENTEFKLFEKAPV